MTQLSDLAVLLGVNLAGGDIMPIQDVSDTANGWTRGHAKQITVTELIVGLNALGVGGGGGGGGAALLAGAATGQTIFGGTAAGSANNRLLLKANASAAPSGGGIGLFGSTVETFRVGTNGHVVMGPNAGSGVSANGNVAVLQGAPFPGSNGLSLATETAFHVSSDNADTGGNIASAVQIHYNITNNNPTPTGYPTAMTVLTAMNAPDFDAICTQVHGFQNRSYVDVPAPVNNNIPNAAGVPYVVFSGQHLAMVGPGIGDRQNVALWAAGNAYAKGDTVKVGTTVYIAYVAHTSGGGNGSPTGSPTSGNWRLLGLPPSVQTIECDTRDDSAGCADNATYYNPGAGIRFENAGNNDVSAAMCILTAQPGSFVGVGPGAGCYKHGLVCSTTLKTVPTWGAAADYIVGSVVQAADGVFYQCKRAHTSTNGGAHPSPTANGNPPDWRVRPGGQRTLGVSDTFLYLGPTQAFVPNGTPLFQVDADGNCIAKSFAPGNKRANAQQVAAPAGGTGTAAGGYDTAAHRDALIALVNEMRNVLVFAGMMKGSA